MKRKSKEKQNNNLNCKFLIDDPFSVLASTANTPACLLLPAPTCFACSCFTPYCQSVSNRGESKEQSVPMLQRFSPKEHFKVKVDNVMATFNYEANLKAKTG